MNTPMQQTPEQRTARHRSVRHPRLNKIEAVIQQPNANRQTREHAGSDTAATGAGAPLDRSVLAAIYGDDAAGERLMLTNFRRVVTEDAAILEQAVARNDISRVAHVSHRTKGTSLIVGAKALAGVCERIEQASRANDRAAVRAGMDPFRQELLRVKTYLDAL